MITSETSVLLESYQPQGQDSASYSFEDMQGEVVARCPLEVVPALTEVEAAVKGGLHAAGFVTYEAAQGLDEALTVGAAGCFPLLRFGLYRRRRRIEAGGIQVRGCYRLSGWQCSLDERGYADAVEAIRTRLRAGDTYQINFTFKMEADFRGDPRAFYRDLCRAQQAKYCSYLEWPDQCLLSASPELFFSLREGQLVARPMKGTRPRGRWAAEDHRLGDQLFNSEKDRSENAMIVDLLRNDLGKVSVPGSVVVEEMWAMERYETVWQLTSGIRSQVESGTLLSEIFTALFPCGSVTGAPKVSSMAIINELEGGPRGPYTGCIGYVSPGLEACFSVAIRTLALDRIRGRAQFGVGSGITWDSSPVGEYEECLVKARILTTARPDFVLLETFRYGLQEGFFLRDRHLGRLVESADYFGFPCDLERVQQVLDDTVAGLGCGEWRVRLRLAADGQLQADYEKLEPMPQTALTVRLAALPLDSGDPFLFHKTSHRRIYDDSRTARPGCDDVILHNERGQVTECCIGNVVAEIDGQCWTPPVSCGLLQGTFRAELLQRGEIGLRAIAVEDLSSARHIYLINSVRKWVKLVVLHLDEDVSSIHPIGG